MTVEPITYPYVYCWRRRLGALSLDGRFGTPCRVVVRGRLNSAWIEFEDGYSACVSRNALRRSKPV